jgi:hypothetical protein
LSRRGSLSPIKGLTAADRSSVSRQAMQARSIRAQVTSYARGWANVSLEMPENSSNRFRQRISGVIPCAGVSACFSREAIQHLNDQNHGEAFRTSSFTEDYDIAFRVSELGFNSAFIAYPANYAIDINIDSGNPGILHRTLPVATREFFPSGLEAAYRAGCSASCSRALKSMAGKALSGPSTFWRETERA